MSNELFDFFENNIPHHSNEEAVLAITDTANHELDVDDSEDYIDEELCDDCNEDVDSTESHSSNEQVISLEPIPMEIHNLRMQLVLEAPTIIPQLKIPTSVSEIDISLAMKDLNLPSFITLRGNSLYYINTGIGDLQDLTLRNKAIFYTLLSDTLRHFVKDTFLCSDTNKMVEALTEYNVEIGSPNDASSEIFLPLVKDVAKDLVTYYITMALSASNDNKSLSTNTIFSLKPEIVSLVDSFVDYSDGYNTDLLAVACKFVNTLPFESQKLLYSNINRTSYEYSVKPKYAELINNALDNYPHGLSFIWSKNLNEIYSFIEDDSNERCDARGFSTNPSRGATSRNNIFNMVKLLDTIEKLLKLSSKHQKFIKLFKLFKDSVALSLSKNSVEVYFDNLHSSISSAFNKNQNSPRPNRRYLAQDMILPTLVGKEVNMLFAADYSGSISDIELKNQLGVVDSILSNQKAHKATILSFCDDIRTITELDASEELVDALPRFGENIGSRGGTSFQSVFDLLSSDESPVELNQLNLICIVSADGAGGRIDYSEKFTSEFSGKVLFLLDSYYNSERIRQNYVDSFVANANFERELLFFESK